MGLIARAIEEAGVPTLTLTSALSITRSVNPPRAAFLDYPLGRTAGPPHAPAIQRRILLDALTGFETITEPGGFIELDHAWSANDDWKEAVMRPQGARAESGKLDALEDDRTARLDVPQYQTEEDRRLAQTNGGASGCPTCVFLD